MLGRCALHGLFKTSAPGRGGVEFPGLFGEEFVLDDLFHGLPPADDAPCVAINEDFCRQGTGVVGGGHAEAVGAGAHFGEDFAGFDVGNLTVLGLEVAGFADGADDVGGGGGGGWVGDGPEFIGAFGEGGGGGVGSAGAGPF